MLPIPHYLPSRQGKSLDYGGKAEKAKGYRSLLKVFSENALDFANKKIYNHIVIWTMPLLSHSPFLQKAAGAFFN